ncbi:MAG TPA: Melibiase subfamily [Opitutaceae bacterium]|nr:Melibiase subfamily [Opitutaceae bacterium]
MFSSKKFPALLNVPALAFSAAAMFLPATSLRSADFHDWAKTPPMGWNSWDAFATTLTDAKAREHADILAEKLKPHGWEYLVVDIQWYEGGATGFDYRKDAKLTLDEFGRLLPALNKFPSAKNGAGFKPLADYVHGKGLKFGIHLMRGIPRQAVAQNTPIKGTSHHAADIADKVNVCEWNPDMYGVDMKKPGAQEYYDSVFEQIAAWGVDFIKVDDLARPYIRNEPEIEAIRRAIDHTGRPMVLSISPGETDIKAAAHVVEHANMWRISDDFWDHWSLLESQFKRLHDWTPWRRPGAWPDADMIPFGTIELGRKTWFTPAEQKTLMTLWCIARSPLMLGADLTKLDAPTLALLTNDEVLAVNQHSENNHQIFRESDGRIGWIADVPGEEARYLALFNTRDPWILTDAKRVWRSEPISAKTAGQQTKFEVSTKGLHTLVLVADPGDSDRFWWPSIWRDVRWVMSDGAEKKAEHDYGSHGEKVSGLRVPEGAVALRGVAHLDDAARNRKRGETMTFSAYAFTADDLKQQTQKVPVKIADLGLGEKVAIRDLWEKQDLGTFENEFAPDIEWHGAKIYKVTKK